MTAAMTADPENQVILPDSLVDIVRDLAEVRARKRALSEQEARLRDEIILQLQKRNATVGLTASGSQIVSLVTQPRTKLNTKKLQALHPEIYDGLIEHGTTLMVKLG